MGRAEMGYRDAGEGWSHGLCIGADGFEGRQGISILCVYIAK